MAGRFGISLISSRARHAALLALGCALGGIAVNLGTAETIPGATQSVQVAVPDPRMATSPFDVTRTLSVPPGFAIQVYARIDGARFMAVAPNGDLLVSNPGAGTITLLRPNGNASTSATFASGLHNPHDIVFHTLNGKSYVYIAESNRVIRAPYSSGETRIGTIEPVVKDLPDASSPSVGGSYGHQLKNIALNSNKLYVSIASTCNACASDTKSDPIRSAIYEYDADDGSNRRLYAQGLRNAEGLAFRPGTSELWAVVNNRDNIEYPYHQDRNGDGTDDFGKVMQDYVDGHPPDLLIRVKDGGHYGWPFCNANPDQGLDNMPYDRDVQLNPNGSKLDCDKITPATKGIAAHSAPLGLSFLQDSGLPEPYRNALVTALHGCWNCSMLNGHKIELYPLDAAGNPGDAVDLVTGWVTDPKGKQRWGRPVDAIPDGKGGIYISDDYSGTIYLLKKSP